MVWAMVNTESTVERLSRDSAVPSAPTPPTIENDHADGASGGEVGVSALGLPDMFVKGGTTSSAHDRMVFERTADAERRRDEAAGEKLLAKERGLAAGNPNEVASQYSHEFTDHPEVKKAYVQLFYMGRGGKEVVYEGTGDIILCSDPVLPDEKMLLIYCPKCKERGRPADDSIITIRQSHRNWHHDERTSGERFVDVDGITQSSAGKVMDSDRFTCGRCEWSACIDNNRVIPR